MFSFLLDLHEADMGDLLEALDGAARMRDIIRDLRTLSRMDSPAALTPVDVRNAVDAALKLTLHEVRARAASAGLCDVFPVGAITRGLGGEEMSEIGELSSAPETGVPTCQ